MALQQSPWTEQLPQTRTTQLTKNVSADVVIVGSGIAGVMTAYYLLKDTNKSVILLEANKVGRGASGHNAGQMASYFEQPFSEIVKRFGLKKASQAQLNVLSAWDLLDRLFHRTSLKHKPVSFAGYAGLSTIKQLKRHLSDCYLQHKANIQSEFLYILNDKNILEKIPKKYAHLYTPVNRERLTRILETDNQEFIAAVTGRKGVLNSALFCHELLLWLKKKYKKRIALYEKTPATEIKILQTKTTITTPKARVTAKEIILCTNGYKQPTITYNKEEAKMKITTTVGLMLAGEQHKKFKHAAVSYFPKTATNTYFYCTRRDQGHKELVCAGGPDINIEEEYDPKKNYVLQEQEIQDFIKTTKFTTKPNYRWEGPMGYTKTNLRCIGRHPKISRLWYNLGCNGVGILPSVYGAKRISLLMQGVQLQKSLFDPSYCLTQAQE